MTSHRPDQASSAYADARVRIATLPWRQEKGLAHWNDINARAIRRHALRMLLIPTVATFVAIAILAVFSRAVISRLSSCGERHGRFLSPPPLRTTLEFIDSTKPVLNSTLGC
jgi:hypothetical protein